MGSVEEHLGGNAMSIDSSRYHLRDLWRSPRGTVLRIEALAMVAIIFSFFLALFGSCRRWSKRWIVQKGFLAAQVLSLSLGTYSIGLMQSSSVKSEMYPIWAVSLFTLFGCIDPVSTYIGLDYKGPLSKLIFQHCLYFGYVMLMSVSTISSDVGKLAIVLLSTITFIKSFHRALAFVQQQPWEHVLPEKPVGAVEPAALVGRPTSLEVWFRDIIIEDIQDLTLPDDTTTNSMTIKDVCISYLFSNQLRERFLGLDEPWLMNEKLSSFEKLVQDGQLTVINYKRALKVVEVELAFLFEAFFTSSEFLYLEQAKGGSLLALASFLGICFVGVVATIIPGAMASHRSSINSAATATGGACAATSVIVGTTAADLIITLVILVSLALLQVVQLIRCWTSNWARLSIACQYTRRSRNKISRWEMGLRVFLVARVNWFDKYLWQDMLGQDTLPALLERVSTKHSRIDNFIECTDCCCILCVRCPSDCVRFFGVFHILELVKVLLFSDITNTIGDVKLHKDVKASIAEFLGTIKGRRIGVEWSALFVKNGLQDWMEYLPYTSTSRGESEAYTSTSRHESEAYAFTRRVIIWHIATCNCDEAEKAAGGNRGGGEDSSSREKNRRVAMDLSKYCFYLVVSAPELLHGPPAQTKEALNNATREIQNYAPSWGGCTADIFSMEWLHRMHRMNLMSRVSYPFDNGAPDTPDVDFEKGVHLGKRLRNDPGGRDEQEGEQSTRRPCSSDHWELLAHLWVQTLLYAAPYGDKQAHMQRLAQGGEFITHLWALLFHLGIDKWEVAGIEELKGAAAAAAEETTEVQEVAAQEDAESCSSSSSGIDELKQQRRGRKYRQRSNLIVKHLHRRCRATKKELPERRQGKEAGGAVGELPREAGAAQVARKTAQEPREDEIEEVPN